MKPVQLGKQGLTVNPVGLGCMEMSFGYGSSLSYAEGEQVLHEALDAGVDFLDTAEMYGPHKNEDLIGRALRRRRSEFKIATKFGVKQRADGSEEFDGSPAAVRRAVEGSLQRLRTDYIDLYYQHRSDPSVPVEETIGAMADLVVQGKVRFIGLSEPGEETIRRAHAVHPLTAVQSEYSLLSRDVETTSIPVLDELGIGLVSYSPLGRGLLTGNIRSRSDLAPDDRRLGLPRLQAENLLVNLRVVDELAMIARDHGFTLPQLSLAWLLKDENRAVIPGTTKSHRVRANVSAAELRLNSVVLKRIESTMEKNQVRGERLPPSMMEAVNR